MTLSSGIPGPRSYGLGPGLRDMTNLWIPKLLDCWSSDSLRNRGVTFIFRKTHMPYTSIHSYDRRKFRSQTSDNMDRWKAEQGRGREKRKIRRKKSRRERVRRKKMQMREKVGKSPIHCVFPMIWGSGGSKSRLAKVAGAEPAGQMRDEKLHALVARSTFQVKMLKTPGVRTTFGSCDVEKVHAVVARSTFPSQKC